MKERHFKFILTLFLIGFSFWSKAGRLDSLQVRLSEIQNENSLAALDEKSILCNDIAVCYQGIGKNQMARSYFLQSIYFTKTRIERENNWDAQNNYDLAYLYQNLAIFEGAEGNSELSNQYMREAEKYYGVLKSLIPREEYKAIMVEFYQSIFSSAYHAEDYELGEIYISKAEKMEEATGLETEALAKIYRLHGEAKVAIGDFEGGQAYFKKALSIADKIDAQSWGNDIIIIQSMIACFYHAHKYEELVAFLNNRKWYNNLESARERAKELKSGYVAGYLNSLFILSYAHMQLYRKTKEQRHLITAYNWQRLGFEMAEYRTVINESEKIGSTLSSPRNKVVGYLMATDEAQKVGLTDSSAIFDAMRIADVYHASRLHLERVSYDLNADNWQHQKTLKNELDFVNRKIEEESLMPDSVFLNLDSLRERAYQLSLEIERAGKETKRELILDEYKLGQDGFEVGMKDFLSQTKKNALTYFFDSDVDSIYILLANSDTSFVTVSPVESNLPMVIKELYELNAHLQMKTEAIALQEELNHRFYEYLFAPIEAHLTSRDILIYPPNELSYISFDALLDDHGKYLVESYSFQYTSSLFSLINPEVESEFPNTIASFYPENYGSGHNLAYLLNGQAEVDEIQRLFEGKAYNGSAATKARFLDVANAHQIVHLASHSVLNITRPYESYIIFDATEDSTDYKLHAYEIFASTLSADLVILSSCNSAQGQIEEGIGTVSLANAFYFAGVPSTISSLWSAQDKSSSEIMTYFYRSLKEGLSKSGSLRKAKLIYLETADKIRQQPFFWANYVLYGNDAPLFKKQSRNSLKSYLFGGGLIVLLFFVGRRYFRSLSKS